MLSTLFLANLACSSAWEYGARAREEPPNFGAWYQMPQPGPYPPSTYERAPPSAPYPGYPRPYSRSPDYYPESSAVTNNMVPSPRKSPPGGFYPSIHASQDVSFDRSHRPPHSGIPRVYSPSSAQFRENIQELRELGSNLKFDNYKRPLGMKKLTREQLTKIMDKQVKAFVNVFKRVYEWRDWIWWGSMKYLQLAKTLL
ncbi:hypothetical protein FO519_004240 [Halicephalobus sp. NKZ332]|nr:hypothetical protein FO519_004240 [Halicephalobus sp. NKZ332]